MLPSDTPLATVKPGFGESPSGFVSAVVGNIRHHVFFSVRDGSLDTYQSGVNAWVRYCTLSGSNDLFFETLWQSFHDAGISAAEFPAFAVAGFADFLYTCEGKTPSTVSSYLSGVRHHFKANFKNLEVFTDPLVAAVKSAIAIDFLKFHLKSDTATLPWTCDLIIFGDEKVLDFSDHRDWAVSVAEKIGFSCLARRSEFLVTADDHFLRSFQVVFELTFSSGTHQWVPSSRAYQFREQRAIVSKVAITFGSAKNDEEGAGNRYTFDRQLKSNGTVAFDLVIDLFDWACEAQPRDEDAFLSYKGEWSLSYSYMLARIKSIASKRGLDPKRYKLHSLRVGGASTLAAAGKPDHFIQKMGRWKSLAFLGYIRLAVRTINESLAALVNPFLLTVEHVKQLNPGSMLF